MVIRRKKSLALITDMMVTVFITFFSLNNPDLYDKPHLHASKINLKKVEVSVNHFPSIHFPSKYNFSTSTNKKSYNIVIYN